MIKTATAATDIRKMEVEAEIEEIMADQPLQTTEEWEAPYRPTRLEYFAAAALQALLTSVSEKKHGTAAIQAVVIAKQIEIVLDKAQG
jgi:hypothetical protein